MSDPSSNERRAVWRVKDMLDAIARIRFMLDGRTFDDMYKGIETRAAFERYLEILSEASRSVPQEWKNQHGPEIPWRSVANLGNQLRHAYHRVDHEVLWNTYENELDPLQIALEAMLQENGS
jgi:uncharacterized protein with HEPN domain